MSTYTEFITKVGDQVVDAMKEAEERTAAVVSSINDAAAKLVPSVVTVPGIEALPSAHEVVTANFAIAGRLLDSQREFVLFLVDALEKFSAPAVKPKAATHSKN